jgi:predicted nucleic acid-binding protein
MQINQVVINASPLICLSKSGLINLLPSMFRDIVVPDLVIKELLAKGGVDPTLEKRITNIVSVTVAPQVASWDLGNGESGVLSFAFSNKEYWAVIDDLEARRCATSLGCRFTGTVGIVVLAKRRGLITSVRDSLKSLKNAGLWLSDSFVEDVGKKAGE